ncbi:MAG TPA: hypothetical protein VK550_08780 [Polyangiaceae bacterium]|nr:hypothetical protein [Polyangiaceae bacterium]
MPPVPAAPALPDAPPLDPAAPLDPALPPDPAVPPAASILLPATPLAPVSGLASGGGGGAASLIMGVFVLADCAAFTCANYRGCESNPAWVARQDVTPCDLLTDFTTALPKALLHERLLLPPPQPADDFLFWMNGGFHSVDQPSPRSNSGMRASELRHDHRVIR